MMTTTIRVLVTLSCVVLLLSFDPASGQNSEVSRGSLAGIEAVAVYVDSVSVELHDAGIQTGNLFAEVERVLVRQDIPIVNEYTDPVPGSPTLYVEVLAILQPTPEMTAYSIRVELMQTAFLERDAEGVSRFVTTWSTGGTGLYGKKWRTALIDDVVAYTEAFAEAYWEANGEWLE